MPKVRHKRKKQIRHKRKKRLKRKGWADKMKGEQK